MHLTSNAACVYYHYLLFIVKGTFIMKKQYTVEKLLDDALDTSSTQYHEILNVFDGVKEDPRAELVFYYAIRKYLKDYNYAFSLDAGMIPADLSTRVATETIKNKALAIIQSSICTTKNHIEYYRFGDCPYNDDELTDILNIEKIIIKIFG